MSKHEAKVTKTTHFVSIFFAVLISFGLGLTAGMYFSNHKIDVFNGWFKPSQVQDISGTKTKSEEPSQAKNDTKNLTADEQISAVKASLNGYYGVNKGTLDKLASDSQKEGSSDGKSPDALLKDKLYKKYKTVLAKEELDRMKKFIDQGNINSGYYTDFFDAQDGTTVKTIEVTEYKDNSIKAKITTSKNSEFVGIGMNQIPTAQEYFNEYKGKGITQAQYVKMLKLNPTKINMVQTNSGNVTIENIDGKWYITNLNVVIISSEIRDLEYKGKALGLGDFIKQYIR